MRTNTEKVDKMPYITIQFTMAHRTTRWARLRETLKVPFQLVRFIWTGRADFWKFEEKDKPKAEA